MSSSDEELTNAAAEMQPESESSTEDRSSLNVSEPPILPEGPEDVTSAPISNEGDEGDESSSECESVEHQNENSPQVTEERKDRKRKKDVLYSRNRRKREREEAELLRAKCSRLTKRNEALKKEETRLLHLFVDATSKIDLLQDRKPPPRASFDIETNPSAPEPRGTNHGNPSFMFSSTASGPNRSWLDAKPPAVAAPSSQGAAHLISTLLQQRSQQSVPPGPTDSGIYPTIVSHLLQLLQQQQQQQQQSTNITAPSTSNPLAQRGSAAIPEEMAAALSPTQTLPGRSQTRYNGVSTSIGVSQSQAPLPVQQRAMPSYLSEIVARFSAPSPPEPQNPALQSILGVLLSMQKYPTMSSTGALGPGLSSANHAGSSLYGAVSADFATPRSDGAASQHAEMDGNTIRLLLEMLSQSLQSSSQKQNHPHPGSDK